ncbi:MAG TPA: FadR/GntR family transcriptional regulator [Anaerolineales bacterium]|nr:FadR/GntR family transcriptional regulator [Anaerolineales bacterium]
MENNQNTENMVLESASIGRLEREPRLYEKLADKILELISTGTWKPGFRLPPERELSEAFGVSRTVVREAVKALEARGVLESVAGGGVSVRLADSDMVSRSLQTYMQLSNRVDFEIRLNEVRRVLEVEMVALAAARRTPEEVVKLHQICQKMRAGVHTAKQMAELDFLLHITLAEATQNDLFKVLLAPVINQLRDQIILTWEDFPRPVNVVFEQHEAIVAAVENGDAEAGRQAMIKHLAFSRDVLEEIRSHTEEKHDEQ